MEDKSLRTAFIHGAKDAGIALKPDPGCASGRVRIDVAGVGVCGNDPRGDLKTVTGGAAIPRNPRARSVIANRLAIDGRTGGFAALAGIRAPDASET